MNKNFWIFIFFCGIFWLKNETEAQTARCDYKDEYHWISGYKTINSIYYKCNLETREANYNEKLTRIDGQHKKSGHNDDNVKWIQNYENSKLKTFSSIFCQKFPNLEVIKINGTELELIDQGSLINCKNLDILFLDGNKIRELPEYLLIRNLKLTKLWIKSNQLTALPENLFLNQNELECLELQRNQINFLPSNIFSSLVKLELLHLYSNRIQSINPGWFVNLQNLKWLSLNDNQISEIPSKSFTSLRNLEKLWIYNNRINALKSDSFDGLQNLKILSLHINEISELPVGIFTPLKSLQSLFLRNNKLTTIHSDSFGIINNKLTDVYPQNNNINTLQVSDLPVGVFTPLDHLFSQNNKMTTIQSDSIIVHNQLTTIYLQNNKINAIDKKFIDNTAISKLYMKNNICSQFDTENRNEIKPNLKRCFDNYQPRFKSQVQTYSILLTTKKPITQLTKQSTTYSTLSPTKQPTTQKTEQIIQCGISKSGHGNIIGGTHIKSGDFPWIAALMTPNGKFFCSGTVVSSRKVVTAAHCIQNKKSFGRLSAGELVVLLGTHDLNQFIEIGRVFHAVYSINIHPDWNALTQSFDADIAVLVLEKEVTFNDHIQPICLIIPNSNTASITIGSVVGYGKSEDETKSHENIPKIIKMPIHDNNDCFAKDEGLASISSGRTFCGGTGTGVGVCNGDSGSGLIVTDGTAFYLRGIVSSSLLNVNRECNVDTYSIFTDLIKYVDWINGISISRFN